MSKPLLIRVVLGNVTLSFVVEVLMDKNDIVKLIPSKVEGLPEVTEMIAYSDRIEILSEGQWKIFYLIDMVKTAFPQIFHSFLIFLGFRLRGWIGEKFFENKSPTESYLRFYTKPEITVYMPSEETFDYETGFYFRIQWLMRLKGFDFIDNG